MELFPILMNWWDKYHEIAHPTNQSTDSMHTKKSSSGILHISKNKNKNKKLKIHAETQKISG